MNNVKRSFLTSLISLVLCLTMFLGTTFAWFTDIVVSGGNVIQSGNLDAEMYWSDEYLASTDSGWTQVKDNKPIFTYDNWEPGYTEIKYIKVANAGNLNFKWKLSIEAEGRVTDLSDVIDVYYVNPVNGELTKQALAARTPDGKLTDVLANKTATEGDQLTPGGSVVLAIAFQMDKLAGNEYQEKSLCDKGFSLKLLATQATGEHDSFDDQYDKESEWPEIPSAGNNASADVPTDANGVVTTATTITGNGMSATVPAGTQLTQGTNKLTLSVNNVEDSKANVTLAEGEELRALDVHISGVAEGNTTPIAVTLTEALPKGLNIGNYTLHHVEDGQTVPMTLLADGATPVHNNFTYDPVTGDVTLYMASFSEVDLIAEPAKWEGNRDYTWYDAHATELQIANADQLAAFSAIVGGMDGQTRDSFVGKTVKLVADINLGDKESENNPEVIFYPIGYYNSEGTYERTNTAITSGLRIFEGTFDGNGHTVSNFYHNTWEMKGDHDWYSPEEQYYRDGMGLFGRVYKGTVKNLTVKNFSSDGEIATTGVIAAYADGATFENIAIFDCNPRVYNIGNGGIVGCVGWYAKEANLQTTFKNITVDNSNKISALWGSYDVACGGIVGQYYPTSGQTSANKPVNGGISFENCHVSAIMDVYNDVCANYQYYAYRYTGMLIGSVRENVTIDGHSYPKMDGITASGCTVHFGTWNDYYYCEIIDNTTASYTHDYQMSRLTEIKAIDGTTITYLDGTTGTVPASGRANYVIVDYTKGHGTENATCYHFKDGAVWTHDMGGIQTGIDENGDGQDDLKEDKQHIYLEFNNLVTGYGWGVTTKGVGDLDGVTILDREYADSVVKFEKADDKNSYSTETTYTVGQFFKAATISDPKLSIKGDQVVVTVSPVYGTNSTVTATYEANTEDWTKGTLTFDGIGAATITITDYYFCQSTTISVNIEANDKFDTNFVNHDKYLYRVGNQNAVALGTIFKALDKANIDSSSVKIDFATIAGTAAGAYSENTTDWTKGTTQFTGTGVVKVTISADGAKPFELHLEVIDATNLTSASGYTGTEHKNFVLVKDISTSSFVNHWNSTIYGNGFTYSLKGGPTKYDSKQGHGILISKNTTFDNIVIIGDVYNSYGAYSNQDHYTAAIDATNTIIQNSYIANCSAPVRGNGVTIINTTLYGGTVANIVLSGGINTFTNLTTVNHKDDRDVLGLGIVVSNEANDNTRIVLNGTLKQYNYVCSSDSSAVPGTEAKAVFNSMFSNSFSDYKTSTGYVNTGIVIMTESLNTDIITDNADTGYLANDDATVTVTAGLTTTVNGAVYAPKGSAASVDNGYSFDTDNHVSTTQGDYLPTFEFDLGDNYNANDGETDTRYCYESVNNEKVQLLYQDGQNGFTFDLTKLVSVTKFGYSLNTTVVCKNSAGVVLATNSTVTLKDAGMYYFEITVSDNIIYGIDGNLTGEVVYRTYTIDVELSVKKASWKNAEITMSSVSQKSGYNSSKYYVLVFLDAISITDYAENGTAETVNLKAEYDSYEITYVNNTSYAWSGFTLTINYKDGRVLTVTFGAPSGLSSPGASSGGKTISLKNDNTYGYVLQSDGKINTKVSGTWSITKCTFKGKNTVTVENTEKIDLNVDKNTTISVNSGSSGGECVTPDTLVTLADGSKKRIDEVTYDDQLLVWDFYSGSYTVVPAAIIVNHGYSEYDIITLTFEDGTTVKAVNAHGFFDADLNKFVLINPENARDYVGHSFVKASGDGYTTVKLVDCTITKEYTESYTLVSAYHYNFIVEDMFSITNAVNGMLEGLVIDNNMKYDVDVLASDIEEYGLYTYADFAEYIPVEIYDAFNGAYLKISVEKGYIEFADIIWLIETYIH